jgi:hypothetical protein
MYLRPERVGGSHVTIPVKGCCSYIMHCCIVHCHIMHCRIMHCRESGRQSCNHTCERVSWSHHALLHCVWSHCVLSHCALSHHVLYTSCIVHHITSCIVTLCIIALCIIALLLWIFLSSVWFRLDNCYFQTASPPHVYPILFSYVCTTVISIISLLTEGITPHLLDPSTHFQMLWLQNTSE